MADATIFELSRIYAQGWNAAAKMPANEYSELDPSKVAHLNPHPTDPKRSRWNDGFRDAIRK
jgi:hypothetical protein